MKPSISPTVLARAAELLATAPPGRVLDTLARHPDREVAEVAVLAVDLEGGPARGAAAELRRAAGSEPVSIA